jgi:hypothetical protein
VLWDTGIPDAVAAMPDGMVVANGAITYRRTKTLAAQIEQIGLKPADVTYVAVSHTHGDHVGNIALFSVGDRADPGCEYDWAMAGPAKPAFASTQIIKKLTGDHDVFGDGSIKIISTPGHTPGHQSLLVNLPKTRCALLHDRRRGARSGQLDAPARAVDEFQTAPRPWRPSSASPRCSRNARAQLWINHDKPQSERLKYAPGLLTSRQPPTFRPTPSPRPGAR